MKLRYKTNPVNEKELEEKSLDKLLLEKWEELNVFTTDIPVLITLWIALFTYQYSIWYGIWIILVVCAIIEWYIISVRNTTKDNIKKYDTVILKKLEEKERKEEKYKKEISDYLKQISENITK